MTPLETRIDEDFTCRLYRGEPFVFECQLEDVDGAVEALVGRTFWGCIMAADGTVLHEAVADILTDRTGPYYRSVFDGSMTDARYGESGLLWSQGEHVAGLGRKIHAQGQLIIYPGPGSQRPEGVDGIAATAHRFVRRIATSGRSMIRLSQQGGRGAPGLDAAEKLFVTRDADGERLIPAPTGEALYETLTAPLTAAATSVRKIGEQVEAKAAEAFDPVTGAIANTVRTDIVQDKNEDEKARARENMGAGSSAITAAYLNTSSPAIYSVPQNLRDSILNGQKMLEDGLPVPDHTAAVAALLADTSARRTLVLPAGGLLNVDRMHVPIGSPIRALVGQSCKIRLRSDYAVPQGATFETSPSLGHFLRFLRPANAYGHLNDVHIEDLILDQGTSVMRGHLLFATGLQRGTIEGVTTLSRDAKTTAVTLDPITDTFTVPIPAGQTSQPFATGQAVSLYSSGTPPTGALPSGIPAFVVAATATTLKLSATKGGPPIDFGDVGTGTLYLALTACWQIVVGGRMVEVTNCFGPQGNGIYNDFLHLVSGDGIGVRGCQGIGGDDGLAAGTEIGDWDDLKNVNIVGCTFKSRLAAAIKLYVNDPIRKLTGIYGDDLVLHGGMERNGTLLFYDNVGTDARTQAARIERMRFTNIRARTGSATRTDPTNAQHVLVQGAADVVVQGDFVADNFPVQEYLVQQSANVRLDMAIGYDGVDSVTEGVISDSVAFGCNDAFADVRPMRNRIKNPAFTGAFGGSPGGLPNGWEASPGINGLTRTVKVLGTSGGRRRLLIGYAGTTTAATSIVLTPHLLADFAAAVGQRKRGSIVMWLDEGSFSGVASLQLQTEGRIGSSLQEAAVTNLLNGLGRAPSRQKAVRQFVNVNVNRMSVSIRAEMPFNAPVNFMLGFEEPTLEP